MHMSSSTEMNTAETERVCKVWWDFFKLISCSCTPQSDYKMAQQASMV